MAPRAAFFCSLLAFVVIVAVASGPAVLAQRTSQGVVTPGDPIWAGMQEPQEPQEPPNNGNDAPAGGRGGRGAGGGPPQPRPYDQVITRDARSDDGIFKVHRVREQLYYEIPKAELGKDFLWVSQMKRTTAGTGLGGEAAGNRVVRWELLGNRVLLRLVDYSLVADPSSPIARAVGDATNPAIVRVFNVAAFNAAGDPVVEVTPLFLTEVPELSVRGRIGARGFDQNRTLLEKVVSFPENINVEVMQTYTAPVDAGGRAGGPAPTGPVMRGNSATVVMSYSMVKLPEKPMMPRLFDERVGYFTRSMSTTAGTSTRRPSGPTSPAIASRRRIRAPQISEPVKPIVYYVDPATPTKWVPYVKEGIEDWQPAFEARGFQQRDHREGCSGRRSGLESRGRALLGDPLAAVNDRERVWPAHPRSADRRDSRGRHPVLSQRA